ncbi:hypothetical protein BT93_B1043 [Corymbia citriodora subsp. variegata]|nr:hypothetical protein BT93_B1043 [Corymbia citriodora subsp. variegata]
MHHLRTYIRDFGQTETSCVMNCAIYTQIYCLTSGACLYFCCYRTKLQREFGLKEDPCNDCLVHFCCMHCVLCQEYRELKSRGFNIEKGLVCRMGRKRQAT